MGNCSFVGADAHIYDSQHVAGLATFGSGTGAVDPLTCFLLFTLPKIYHCLIVGPCHNILGRWIKVLKPHGK
jgi:hypothetical protein